MRSELERAQKGVRRSRSRTNFLSSSAQFVKSELRTELGVTKNCPSGRSDIMGFADVPWNSSFISGSSLRCGFLSRLHRAQTHGSSGKRSCLTPSAKYLKLNSDEVGNILPTSTLQMRNLLQFIPLHSAHSRFYGGYFWGYVVEKPWDQTFKIPL